MMKHRRVPLGLAVLCLLLFAWVTACGTAQLNVQTQSSTSITTGVKGVTTGGEETTITSLFAEEIVEKQYEAGLYMGLWAGNVETIPAHPKSLPDFFFSGPPPIAPENPFQKDPTTIKTPLWVFGDEVAVGAHLGQIREAKKDGRPVVFYALGPAEVASVLQLENRFAPPETPLDRLIVSWLPWEHPDTVTVFSRDGNDGIPGVFRMLVEATLYPRVETGGMSTTTSMIATPVTAAPGPGTQKGRGAITQVIGGFTDGSIPTPLIDGAFSYLGDGHFTRVKGQDFYWRDGHFVNPDGSPLEVPESIKDTMKAKGYTGELTQPSFP
jgi:hypothetical protein